jgi:predicted cupin superfamily sugar epimerase
MTKDPNRQFDAIVRALNLKPHPEGGWYDETWRAAAAPGERASGTAIYYALTHGQRSHWHRIDAAETWHFYAGSPLELSLAASDQSKPETLVLGPDIAAGQRPQVLVPAHHWQSARSLGDWTLVGCTVSPGFEFSGFELAPPDWTPKA